MEIDRALLKMRARNALQGRYWFILLTCFVFGLVSGGIHFNTSFKANFNTNINTSVNTDVNAPLDIKTIPNIVHVFREIPPLFAIIGGVLVFTVLVSLIASIIFTVFLTGPAEVSFAKTKYDSIVNGLSKVDNFVFGFKNNYINIVKIMFCRNLRLFLWSLLPTGAAVAMVCLMIFLINNTGMEVFAIFITLAVASIPIMLAFSIPAIVARYKYMMVPYIVADNPHITSNEALKRSRDMMNGVKLSVFVLRLSFLGWYILGALCCGIGIIFVSPYYHAAETLLYQELKGPYEALPVVDTNIVG